MKGISSFTRKM